MGVEDAIRELVGIIRDVNNLATTAAVLALLAFVPSVVLLAMVLRLASRVCRLDDALAQHLERDPSYERKSDGT